MGDHRGLGCETRRHAGSREKIVAREFSDLSAPYSGGRAISEVPIFCGGPWVRCAAQAIAAHRIVMKSKPLMARLEPEVRDKVEEAACEEGRSLSNMIGRIVKEWAMKRATERSQQEAA